MLHYFDTDMQLPAAVLELMARGHCMVAGGSVVRHLISADKSDIDVFFYGDPWLPAREAFIFAVGKLYIEGWSGGIRTHDGAQEYPHERAFFENEHGEKLDLIWCERWTSVESVLDGFDLTCCQVGIARPAPGPQLVATSQGVHALMTRTFKQWRNVWPTTPKRIEKYRALGFQNTNEERDPFTPGVMDQPLFDPDFQPRGVADVLAPEAKLTTPPEPPIAIEPTLPSPNLDDLDLEF